MEDGFEEGGVGALRAILTEAVVAQDPADDTVSDPPRVHHPSRARVTARFSAVSRAHAQAHRRLSQVLQLLETMTPWSEEPSAAPPLVGVEDLRPLVRCGPSSLDGMEFAARSLWQVARAAVW